MNRNEVSEDFDIKYGVIKYQNQLFKSCAVFLNSEYYTKKELNKICNNLKNKELKLKNLYVTNSDDVKKSACLDEEYKNYLEFKNNGINDKKELKILKYRYYLKVVKRECNINEQEKILTFVLFNPSYANQYQLDSTIKNCAYLTFENKKYNGFEILNLFACRDSNVELFKRKYRNFKDKKISVLDKQAVSKELILFNSSETVFKEVVLAWGCSEFKKDMAKIRWSVINERYKNPKTKYYALANNDKINSYHLGNEYWNSIHLPFKQSLGEEKITLYQISNEEILKFAL